MLTRDFVENFMALENKSADIQIKHILYGNQKLNRCVLHPFVDEERIGLIIEDEERYVTMKELHEVSIDNNRCCLKSDVMELYIDYTIL